MKSKLTIGQIAHNISAICGCSNDLAEKYLNTLADEITRQLLRGEEVCVRYIGTFSRLSDGEDPVSFIPDPTLAALCNAPFEMFDSVILHDNVTDEMLKRIDLQVVNPESDTETVSSDVIERANRNEASVTTQNEYDSNPDHSQEVVISTASTEKSEVDSEEISETSVTAESNSISHDEESVATQSDRDVETDLSHDVLTSAASHNEPGANSDVESGMLVTAESNYASNDGDPVPDTDTPAHFLTTDQSDSSTVKSSSASNLLMPLIIGFIFGLILGAVLAFWYVTDQNYKARAPFIEEEVTEEII